MRQVTPPGGQRPEQQSFDLSFSPPAIVRSPGPSRLAFRLTRLWNKTRVRRVVLVGLPGVAVLALGVRLAIDPAVHAFVAEQRAAVNGPAFRSAGIRDPGRAGHRSVGEAEGRDRGDRRRAARRLHPDLRRGGGTGDGQRSARREIRPRDAGPRTGGWTSTSKSASRRRCGAMRMTRSGWSMSRASRSDLPAAVPIIRACRCCWAKPRKMPWPRRWPFWMPHPICTRGYARSSGWESGAGMSSWTRT